MNSSATSKPCTSNPAEGRFDITLGLPEARSDVTAGRRGDWRRGKLSLIAEQRPETFLLKMAVVRENFGQPILAHRLHRNAIRQAVAFVGPRSVESHAGEKRGPALRNNTDARILENTLGICEGFVAHRLGGRRKDGKVFDQHFIRRDEN